MTSGAARWGSEWIRSLLVAGIATCLFTIPSYSQSGEANVHIPPNSVYAELGGSGFLYSLNAEHLVSPHFGIRVGISTLGFARETTHVLFPATASLLLEQADSGYYVEFGGGPTLVLDPTISDVMGTAIVGLRYQPGGGGLLLRLAFVPLLSVSGEIDLLWGSVGPSAGLAIGYSF